MKDDDTSATPNRFPTHDSFIDYGGVWFTTSATTPEVEFDLRELEGFGVVEEEGEG